MNNPYFWRALLWGEGQIVNQDKIKEVTNRVKIDFYAE